MKKPTICALIFPFGVAVYLAAGTPVRAAEPAGKPDAARLIAELGSKQYRTRQAAAQALERMGESALVWLQQARDAGDPEIRHRAEQLVEQIKREADTARLLEPKRVQLEARDKPLPEVVADLAARTGFSVRLGSAEAGLAGHKLTLETGETTFWKAFDQLAEKAGLVEPRDGSARLGWQEADTDLRRLRMQARLQVLQVQREGLSLRSSGEEPLLLVSGKPPRLPTWYAGAIRIRAVPLPRDLAASAGETLVLLEATPQPGLTWRGLVGDRLDLVRDEAGRNLTPVALEEAPGLSGVLVVQNKFVARRAEGNGTVTDLRYRPIRLKLAATPSRLLKEIKGVLSAEVQTPPEPRLTVEHILQAGGKSIRGSNGEVLRILQVGQQADGAYRVHIDFEDPSGSSDPLLAGPGRRILMRARPNGLVNGGMVQGPLPGAASWSLLDRSGLPLSLVGREDTFVWVGTGIRYETTFTYASRNGRGSADQLVYSGPRTLQIDIPFTLHDVPLP
jgi:hypothetical protein